MSILSEKSILEFKHHLKRGSESLNIKVSDNQIKAMIMHVKQMMAWNKKINLTAIKNPLQIAEKHCIDSIAASSFLENKSVVMDMGSGAGFPGIPIKIMNPSLKVVLVDSSRKKVNFLKHVIRCLELTDIEAIHCRVQDLCKNEFYKNRFDIVISRAFTELSNFGSLAEPFLNKKGAIFAMKGKHGKNEITKEMLTRFELKIAHYLLPFEKSDRYMITLLILEKYHESHKS